MPEELSAAEVIETTPSAATTGEAEVPAASPEPAKDAAKDLMEEVWEKHQENEPAAEETAKTEPGKEGEQTAAKEEGTKPTSDTSIPAPNTWTKEEKAAWDAAPPEVKAALVRRASQVEELAKESLDARNFARVMEPIGQTLADPELQGYLKTLQMPDGSKVFGNPKAIASEIRDLFNLKRTIISNPAEGMRQISQWLAQWGLDPGQYAQADNGQQMNPETAQLRNELAQMKAALARREYEDGEQRRFAAQREGVQRIAQTVEHFTASKDAEGNPSFPHLHGEHAEDVGEAMGRFIRANVGPEGLTEKLFKTAYDVAVFAHPSTKEAEFKAREERRVKEFKENSERAKKAAGVRPRPGGPGETYDKMSTDEALNAVWAKYNT